MPSKKMEAEHEDPTRAVDERSDKLIAEFYEHFAEARASSPDLTQREVFEGWALQKIAGLQVAVEKLADAHNTLGVAVRSYLPRGR